MKKKQTGAGEFYKMGWPEVMEALIHMLEELDMAGSTTEYNLYEAVAKEWEKARLAHHIYMVE